MADKFCIPIRWDGEKPTQFADLGEWIRRNVREAVAAQMAEAGIDPGRYDLLVEQQTRGHLRGLGTRIGFLVVDREIEVRVGRMDYEPAGVDRAAGPGTPAAKVNFREFL